MNYFKIYKKLIKRALKNERALQYVERHHVFPVSIFGSNDFVANLTFREHFIAHRLLVKIYEKRYGEHHSYTRKMYMAIHRMIYSSPKKIHKSSRLYEYARKCARQSKIGKERLDMKGKSFFGASEERIREGIEKMRVKKTGMKILNYPKNRKSPPCSEEKRKKISLIRKQTVNKFITMSNDEFWDWVHSCKKYANYKGKIQPNHNIVFAMKARGIELSTYYTEIV